ncbi:sensor histidine kinase [Actinoplanes sp. L3-i22]|uniref:sensor histidine kinase n=1 Tax=Actinoplanes sp. L3-i22 TaxID=2836373 RepID=UPI001C78B7BD|nr:histidine kinase [Actinoplanes sp. L3-i22]BCY07784.1 two-component sensor histidine kinase [Actinoplanes sp. L3-i22]
MGLRARWRSSTRWQDIGTAAATFAAGLAFNLLGLTGVWSLPVPGALAGVSGPGHTVLLALGCLAMLGKRRRPVPALVAGVLVTAADTVLGGSVGLVVVLFDLIFSAGLFATARARTAVTTAVFVVIGTASVVGGLATGEFRIAVFIVLQLTPLLFVPLWWAANIRRQRELGRLDAERTARDAVLAERAAMARDLHDVIAAHLSTTAIHSGAALARPPDTARDRDTLRAVRTSSLAALEEMRSMIMLLRADDPAAADPTLPGGLDRLPALVRSATGLRITSRVDDIPELPASVSHTVYRIVREALTNAAKHAPGADVSLEVRQAGDHVAVSVTNTLTRGGAADHAALSAGTGLLSIQDRAALLGGILTAAHDEDHFRVRAMLPLHPAAVP